MGGSESQAGGHAFRYTVRPSLLPPGLVPALATGLEAEVASDRARASKLMSTHRDTRSM